MSEHFPHKKNINQEEPPKLHGTNDIPGVERQADGSAVVKEKHHPVWKSGTRKEYLKEQEEKIASGEWNQEVDKRTAWEYMKDVDAQKEKKAEIVKRQKENKEKKDKDITPTPPEPDTKNTRERLPHITELAKASRKAQEAYDAKAQEYYANRGALQSFAGSARKFFGGDEMPQELLQLREQYQSLEKERREAVAHHVRERSKRSTGNYEQSKQGAQNEGVLDIIKRYDYRFEYRSAYSEELGKQSNERIDMKVVEAYHKMPVALRRGMSYGALTGLAVAGGAPLVGAATLVAARMGGGMAVGTIGAAIAGRINIKKIKNLSERQQQELVDVKESYQQSVEDLSALYDSRQTEMSTQEARNMRRQIGFASLGGLIGGMGAGVGYSAMDFDFSAVESTGRGATQAIEDAGDVTTAESTTGGTTQALERAQDTTLLEQERALGYTRYAPGDTVYDIAHEQVVNQAPEMEHLSQYERDNLVMNFIEKLRHDPELSVAMTGSYSPDFIQAGDEVRLDSWRQLMSQDSVSVHNRVFDWQLDRMDDAHGRFDSMLEAADALDSTTQAGESLEGGAVSSAESVSELAQYEVQVGDNLWNLWAEHSASPLTDAQRVAMEEMVRANPAAFGIDSGNPDLIYTGEDINLQAMFSAAQEQGIISAEQNPGLESTSPVPREAPASSQGDPIESQPAGETPQSTTESTPNTTEGGADGFVLFGDADQMAQQIEEYLASSDQIIAFEDARPYFDTVLAEGNYDTIRANILDTYGGDDVYIKAVGIDPNTGHQVVDFTNTADINNQTYFRFDLQEQAFYDWNIDESPTQAPAEPATTATASEASPEATPRETPFEQTPEGENQTSTQPAEDTEPAQTPQEAAVGAQFGREGGFTLADDADQVEQIEEYLDSRDQESQTSGETAQTTPTTEEAGANEATPTTSSTPTPEASPLEQTPEGENQASPETTEPAEATEPAQAPQEGTQPAEASPEASPSETEATTQEAGNIQEGMEGTAGEDVNTTGVTSAATLEAITQAIQENREQIIERISQSIPGLSPEYVSEQIANDWMFDYFEEYLGEGNTRENITNLAEAEAYMQRMVEADIANQMIAGGTERISESVGIRPSSGEFWQEIAGDTPYTSVDTLAAEAQNRFENMQDSPYLNTEFADAALREQYYQALSETGIDTSLSRQMALEEALESGALRINDQGELVFTTTDGREIIPAQEATQIVQDKIDQIAIQAEMDYRDFDSWREARDAIFNNVFYEMPGLEGVANEYMYQQAESNYLGALRDIDGYPTAGNVENVAEQVSAQFQKDTIAAHLFENIERLFRVGFEPDRALEATAYGYDYVNTAHGYGVDLQLSRPLYETSFDEYTHLTPEDSAYPPEGSVLHQLRDMDTTDIDTEQPIRDVIIEAVDRGRITLSDNGQVQIQTAN